MIEINELSKRYEDGNLALDGVSYAVNKGEILCLLGANGAGKTTTINILLDFIQPTGGCAKIGGIDCNEFPLKVKEFVSYVPENVQLYGMFTARQNLAFFSQLSGASGHPKRDFLELMHTIGLSEEVLHRRVRSFSKGMRQKLGIGIALLKDPQVILMDEPTSGLDPRSAHEFLDLLRALQKAGKTIMMTTHDIFRAKIIADRVGIMKRGKLVGVFEKEELVNQDLEEVYMNKMDAAEEEARPMEGE